MSIKLNLKHQHSFWVCLVISIGLIIGGFFCPPLGSIDGSVLTAVGIMFLYPTLSTVNRAIDKGSDIKLSKGDMSVEIDNPDDNEA